MGLKLRRLIETNAHEFLGSLARLKTTITNAEVLSSALVEIHRDFLKLVSTLRKSRERREARELETANGITRYRMGTFELLFHSGYGMLEIATGDANINGLVFSETKGLRPKEQLERAIEMLEMYIDYEKHSCDFCGEYALVPGFVTPCGRSLEDDFVLVFHPKCRKEKYDKYARE
jgi:hypothetical protein